MNDLLEMQSHGYGSRLYRYEIGKRRLEEIWGIHVITTPNALAGSDFLYEHPEARGEDLMWALKDKEINGTILVID